MYYVFEYDQYYPSGGMGDYKRAYPSLEEARAHVAKHEYDFWEIVVVDGEGELAVLEGGYEQRF